MRKSSIFCCHSSLYFQKVISDTLHLFCPESTVLFLGESFHTPTPVNSKYGSFFSKQIEYKNSLSLSLLIHSLSFFTSALNIWPRSHYSVFILIRVYSDKRGCFSSLFTLLRFQIKTDIYPLMLTLILKMHLILSF